MMRRRERLLALIGNGDVRSTAATKSHERLQLLAEQSFDCIVLDVAAPDANVDAVIDHVHGHSPVSETPLVMYSEEPMLLDEAMTDRLSRSALIPHVQSPDRLLDEISLLLHRPFTALGRRATSDVGKAARRRCSAKWPARSDRG